jgi:hypothetical protein
VFGGCQRLPFRLAQGADDAFDAQTNQKTARNCDHRHNSHPTTPLFHSYRPYTKLAAHSSAGKPMGDSLACLVLGVQVRNELRLPIRDRAIFALQVRKFGDFKRIALDGLPIYFDS